MDGLHGQGVPQDEGDVLVLAQVGQPVPGEHALTADDQSVAEGADSIEEGVGPCGQIAGEDGLALVIEHVEEHAPGMQIDAGVESVLPRVVANHRVPPWRRAALIPHRGWERHFSLKLPRWDRAQTRDPFYQLATGSGPSPRRP